MAETDIKSINKRAIHDTKAREDIETLNSQFKDVAKKTIVEGNKIYLAKNDGTKLDEGTDLPTSSGEKGDPGTSVTISSIVESAEDGGTNVVTFSDGNILNVKNGNKGNDGTSGSGENTIEAYKTEYIGELYQNLGNYVAWCPCDLHFDKILNKYVMLIYSTTGHIHNDGSTYVAYIDKESYVATEPVKCKFIDSNGSTDITPTQAGSCSYIILKDGTYLMLHPINDGSVRRFISEDNGKTWKSTNILTDCFPHPWQMKELSNGRIICSDDSRKVGFMYSDDKGLTWTKVVPATCGGDYEAEALIIELQPNKLMAIARYSMSGIGYNEIGDSEPAIISYSNDNGTSWTAWQKSTSITNMNASSCTGIIHDGIVEIFATTRWYHVNDSKYNNDWKNTGKNGAMFHYVATIENALKDNFTNMGVVIYSNGTSAGDFHSPCIALDDNKNGLIVYFDKGTFTTANHHFIRCTNNYFSYITADGSNSSNKAYSAKYTDKLINDLNTKVLSLQLALSKIPGSGVDVPTGVWSRILNWNATDAYTTTLYPYAEGSDFYGKCHAMNSQKHEFKTDNGTYAYMYTLIGKLPVSEKAKSFKFVLNYNMKYSYYVVVKDGMVTACSVRAGEIHDDNANVKICNSSPCTDFEVFEGGFTMNGKSYELTKATPSNFITNVANINNGAYVGAYSTAVIGDGKSKTSTNADTDYTGTFIGYNIVGYNNYYRMEYWEKY